MYPKGERGVTGDIKGGLVRFEQHLPKRPAHTRGPAPPFGPKNVDRDWLGVLEDCRIHVPFTCRVLVYWLLDTSRRAKQGKGVYIVYQKGGEIK